MDYYISKKTLRNEYEPIIVYKFVVKPKKIKKKPRKQGKNTINTY